MQRRPEPGTFTVKPKRDGGFALAGVRADGTRLRMKVATLTEGHTLGRSLFQGLSVARPEGVTLPTSSTVLDEFGVPTDFRLPTVTAETSRPSILQLQLQELLDRTPSLK